MQYRTTIALAVVGVLLASFLLPSGLLTPAFATEITSGTTIGQHVPNHNTLTIESVSLTMKKASNMVTDVITVKIRQDGMTLASKDISSSLLSTSYKTLTAKFNDPVKVAAKDFDIVISFGGKGIVSVQAVSNNVPGNMFVDNEERTTYDLKYSIASQTTTAGGTDGGSSGGTDSTGGTGSTGGSGSTTTAKVVLIAKNSVGGAAIPGMHFTIWKGLTKVAEGFTPNPVQLPVGETYVLVPTQGYQTTTFDKWEDTKSTTIQRSLLLSKDTTLGVLYKVASSDGTGTGGGDTGTGDTGGSTGGGDGGTSTAGANQVAVNSQLLNGATITGMAVELREAANGHIAQNSFTPATLDMQPGIEYKAIMYPFTDTYFRHWTDGGLHRYHLVDTAHDSGDTLTAQYERVSASQAAHLMINAKTSGGQPIGGTTGSEEDQNLNAEPGLEVLVAPPGSMTAYTAGFTGGSEIAQAFYFAKGQTYTVVVQEFGQYKFSHWQDNGSTNRARAVPLNGDLTLTAIYDVVS